MTADLAAAFHLAAFRDYLSLEAGHSDNTIMAYERDLQRLSEFAASKGVRDPRLITTPLLREFVFLLKDLGLSGATIRRNISAVRTWFSFLMAEGLVERDPSDRLETPKRWRGVTGRSWSWRTAQASACRSSATLGSPTC